MTSLSDIQKNKKLDNEHEQITKLFKFKKILITPEHSALKDVATNTMFKNPENILKFSIKK